MGPAQLPNAILTSADGFAWHEPGNPLTLRGISFGRDAFVAVGSSGAVLTSPDGTTRQTHESGASPQLNDIADSGRASVAVGDQGTILTMALYDVTHGNGRFVAVGGGQPRVQRDS